MTALAQHRQQLELLSRTLDREAHILLREPEVLPSHSHNTLYLDEGEEGPFGPLLVRAREVLEGRPWLRLTNRPPVERSALIRVLEHGADVSAVAWSPDGTLLASAGADNTLRLWDPATGKPRAVLQGHEDSVRALAWSPDSALLASRSSDHTVRLWDLATGKPPTVIEIDPSGGEDLSLIWSAGGALWALERDAPVRLWGPAEDWFPVVRQDCGVGSAQPWAWSPSGALLALGRLGRVDGKVEIRNPSKGNTLVLLEGHTRAVEAVAWSPDGTLLASGGEDNTVRLWDSVAGKPVAVLEGHDDTVRSLAWSPDGALLASGGEDGLVLIWDPSKAMGAPELSGHRNWIWDLAWSPNGTILASAGYDNSVRLWDAGMGKSLAVLEGHDEWAWVLAWSPNGSILASGSDDHTVRLWDTSAGEQVAVM